MASNHSTGASWVPGSASADQPQAVTPSERVPPKAPPWQLEEATQPPFAVAYWGGLPMPMEEREMPRNRDRSVPGSASADQPQAVTPKAGMRGCSLEFLDQRPCNTGQCMDFERVAPSRGRNRLLDLSPGSASADQPQAVTPWQRVAPSRGRNRDRSVPGSASADHATGGHAFRAPTKGRGKGTRSGFIGDRHCPFDLLHTNPASITPLGNPPAGTNPLYTNHPGARPSHRLSDHHEEPIVGADIIRCITVQGRTHGWFLTAETRLGWINIWNGPDLDSLGTIYCEPMRAPQGPRVHWIWNAHTTGSGRGRGHHEAARGRGGGRGRQEDVRYGDTKYGYWSGRYRY